MRFLPKNHLSRLYNLLDLTFIIPIYIDSEDRVNNINSTLGYINANFTTNVIVYELSNGDFLDFGKYKNLNIRHVKEKFIGEFHRTKYLNIMLSMVETPVVSNYDIDVVLPISSYIDSVNIIKSNRFDAVYPYGFGLFQKKVPLDFDRSLFDKSFDLNLINQFTVDGSAYGHCIFLNTDGYKKFGGENEEFISYGPEDYERFNRFSKFGMVYRIEDFVYHFEHSRTEFSTMSNPHFAKNNEIFNNLKDMSGIELLHYYSNLGYLKKYGFELKPSLNLDIPIEKKPILNVGNCICGFRIDRVKYNFCQKCNRNYQ